MTDGLAGIMLDFDGTIAETERFGHRVAYNHAFAELGLDWRWDEELYGELLRVAGGKERLRHYVEHHQPDLCGDGATSELISEIHRAKTHHFAKIAPTIPLRSGVSRLVREANAAGVAVAICTTASETGVQALLAQDPHLLSMIALIAGNGSVSNKKPAPDVYLWALGRLGLRAANCVAIEDSNVGLRSALAAGLTTIVTISDYTAGDEFAGACAVLSSLDGDGERALSVHGPRPEAGLVDLAFLQAILVACS